MANGRQILSRPRPYLTSPHVRKRRHRVNRPHVKVVKSYWTRTDAGRQLRKSSFSLLFPSSRLVPLMWAAGLHDSGRLTRGCAVSGVLRTDWLASFCRCSCIYDALKHFSQHRVTRYLLATAQVSPVSEYADPWPHSSNSYTHMDPTCSRDPVHSDLLDLVWNDVTVLQWGKGN